MNAAIWLVGTSNVISGLPYRLDAGQHLVGRIKSAQIVISDATVSRRHAFLVHESGALSLEDLESANGTFVNEERVSRSALRVGDHVRFGAILCAISSSPFTLPAVSEEESTYEIPMGMAQTIKMDGLSLMQRQIVFHLLEGRSEPEIAAALGKSPHTIHSHVKAIYSRLDVHSRAELLGRAIGHR